MHQVNFRCFVAIMTVKKEYMKDVKYVTLGISIIITELIAYKIFKKEIKDKHMPYITKWIIDLL